MWWARDVVEALGMEVLAEVLCRLATTSQVVVRCGAKHGDGVGRLEAGRGRWLVSVGSVGCLWFRLLWREKGGSGAWWG